ncbi:MAG: tRNA dihydrouridine(20/20a) synthase DusA [Pseudomonadota bacterium]
MLNTCLHPNRRLSIAPMLDWTDRHFRFFIRLISRHVLLYTEMITTSALLHGDTERFLRYDPSEHPLAIQLGGSDPKELAECARLAERAVFDEVNLNVGCPSDRVRNGRFGACLMAEPALVADCVRAMQETVDIPVTVKTRIGIDDQDSYPALCRFIEAQIDAGCDHFIIHARKAWLQGLSPKQNREIPPLRYDIVEQLKQDYPQQGFTLNGGIKSLTQALEHLQHLDGVMIGREAYHNPWILADADRLIFNDPHPIPTRHQVLERLMPFIEKELQNGIALNHITRHILGLFHGCPGARAWRRLISEEAHKPGAGPELIQRAASHVRSSQLPFQE